MIDKKNTQNYSPFSAYRIIAVFAALIIVFFSYFMLSGVKGSTTVNVSLNVNPNLQNGLVGHWTFDGPKMIENAADSSSSGDTGYLQGFTSTTTVPGVLGQALHFNGTSDSVEVSSPSFIVNPNTAFSVSLWVQADEIVSGAVLVALATDITANPVFQILVSTTAGYQYIAWGNHGSHFVFGRISDNVHPDLLAQMNHLVLTYDGSDVLAGYQAYWNGEPATVSLGGSISAGGTVTTFGKKNVADVYFSGTLDDIRLYNRVLDASAVERLYQLGATTYINTTINKNDNFNEGLVGHWTFDGVHIDMASNTAEVLNRVGSNNSGNWLNHSSTTAPGRIGQAIEFDGVDDYINVGDVGITEPATVCMWMRPDDTTTDRRLLSQANGGIGISGSLAIDAAGDDWDIYLWNGSSWVKLVDLSATWVGEWHHLCVIYAGQNATAFWDGIVQNSGATDGFDFNTYDISIGGRLNGTHGNEYDGLMDDFRIYNQVLATSTIERLYELGATTHVNTSITKGATLSEGLVGYWTFDGSDMDTANDIIYDLSGSGNNGTTTGFDVSTTTRPGRIGQALYFDGSNDIAYLGTTEYISTTTPFTIAFWFNIDSFADAFPVPVTLDSNVSGQNFYITMTNNGCCNDIFFGAAGDEWVDSLIDFNMQIDRWYHMAITYNGSGAHDRSNFQAYIDSTSQTLNSTTIGNSSDQTNRLGIGVAAGLEYEFNGPLDDFRIYNRELNAAEIQELYELGGGS